MFKEARKVVKNFTSLITGWFFIRLLSAGATMYIAKTLGPTDFGALAFGLSLVLSLASAPILGWMISSFAKWLASRVRRIGYWAMRWY